MNELRMVQRLKKPSYTFPPSSLPPKPKKLELNTSYETSKTSQSVPCPLAFRTNSNPSKASTLAWSRSKITWNLSSKVLCPSTTKSFTTYRTCSICYRIWRVRLLGEVKGKIMRDNKDRLRWLRTINCWSCIWVHSLGQLLLYMISYVLLTSSFLIHRVTDF